jgi:hypothetical protein
MCNGWARRLRRSLHAQLREKPNRSKVIAELVFVTRGWQ